MQSGLLLKALYVLYTTYLDSTFFRNGSAEPSLNTFYLIISLIASLQGTYMKASGFFGPIVFKVA